jgi:hypothetical protein
VKRQDFAFVSSANQTISTSTSNHLNTSTLTNLNIGHLGGNGNHLNSGIYRILYYPKRLTNAEIQALVATGGRVGNSPNQVPVAGQLGSAAYMSVEQLLRLPSRMEFNEAGTGASRTVTIRRPYRYLFQIVNANGSTITAQPLATCEAGVDYTLTFNAPVGTLLTYSITQILP